jgi:hypothetical protein
MMKVHLFYTLIIKNRGRLYDIGDDKCNEDEWDYYTIGGRYANLLPISKRCKMYHQDLSPIWVWDTENYHGNTNLHFVNIARLRNIDRTELLRMDVAGCINPFQPYVIIVEQLDGTLKEMKPEDMSPIEETWLRNYLNDPRVQSYYAVLLDVHV